MKESEALRIVKYLNTAFPRDAIEAESARLYATEISLLHDGAIGEQAARECARTLDRFPSIHEIREAYKSISRRVSAERETARLALEPGPAPEEAADVGRMLAETLHRMEAPDARDVQEAGKGDCADCGKHGNVWTFGTSGRLLCGACCSSRLRARSITQQEVAA